MNHLVNAIWAGELAARNVTTDERVAPESLPKMVFLTKGHPEIEICETGETRLSSSRELPDGGLEIDFRAVIALPNDPDRWTMEHQRAAIDVLSNRGLRDFSVPFRIAISSLTVKRDDFASYCTIAGYPLPAFWFGKQSVRTSLVNAERDCADWLRSLAKQPKRHPKAWYREEAIRRYPRLISKGFDRAWERATPKSTEVPVLRTDPMRALWRRLRHDLAGSRWVCNGADLHAALNVDDFREVQIGGAQPALFSVGQCESTEPRIAAGAAYGNGGGFSSVTPGADQSQPYAKLPAHPSLAGLFEPSSWAPNAGFRSDEFVLDLAAAFFEGFQFGIVRIARPYPQRLNHISSITDRSGRKLRLRVRLRSSNRCSGSS